MQSAHGQLPPATTPPTPRQAGEETRWPPWPLSFAPIGFLVAVGFSTALIAPLAAAFGGGDTDDLPASLVLAGTLVQDAIFVATAILLAATIAKPRAWHFGLSRTRLWPAVGATVVAALSFYVFVGVYSALVDPTGEQTVAKDLGADRGGLALVAAGILIVVVAPVAEEFFFRGFFYRALRSRLGIMAAAAVDGSLFGAIHYSGAETLSLLPMLAVLGLVFCLLYERTGSLFPGIAMHAANNGVAYASTTDNAVALSIALAAIALAGSLLIPAYLRDRPEAVV